MIENGKSIIVSKKIEKGDKYIPAEYVRLLYDTIDNVRDKFYVTWHIETGVRVSDIVGQVKRGSSERLLGQEINRIDWDRNCIQTYDHKKDRWRLVHFTPVARQALKLWMKERENLKIQDRALFPYSEKMCNRILKKWCERISFPYADAVSSHWCRHTFIRLSRKAGRDMKIVQQNTGDTVKTILEWYSDLSSEDIQKELAEKPLV